MCIRPAAFFGPLPAERTLGRLGESRGSVVGEDVHLGPALEIEPGAVG